MSRNQGRRIIVGVDFDLCGDDAITEAVKMVAEGSASELHAVYVLDPNEVIDAPEMPALFTEARVLEQAPVVMRDRIDDIARNLGLPLRPGALKLHVRLGRPAAAIVQVAVDYDADMIVVGTHGRRGLERLLVGSVAQEIVRRASCPVLIARPKDHSLQARSERPAPPYAPGEAPVAQPDPVDRPLHISTERAVEPSTTARVY
jgi:nucleotide-binding universal stress UspA family protein